MELDQKNDFEYRGKPPADAERVASFASYDLFISGQRNCQTYKVSRERCRFLLPMAD